MSRGLGKNQRLLFDIIRQGGRPKTWAEIRGERLDPTVERSARRALQRMGEDGMILAIGKGGPGDPYRYCIHPIVFAAVGDVQGYRDAVAVFEADNQRT